jgi:hypothetical protein
MSQVFIPIDDLSLINCDIFNKIYPIMPFHVKNICILSLSITFLFLMVKYRCFYLMFLKLDCVLHCKGRRDIFCSPLPCSDEKMLIWCPMMDIVQCLGFGLRGILSGGPCSCRRVAESHFIELYYHFLLYFYGKWITNSKMSLIVPYPCTWLNILYSLYQTVH